MHLLVLVRRVARLAVVDSRSVEDLVHIHHVDPEEDIRLGLRGHLADLAGLEGSHLAGLEEGIRLALRSRLAGLEEENRRERRGRPAVVVPAKQFVSNQSGSRLE